MYLRFCAALSFLMFALPHLSVFSQEIGFIEDFSLSEDRDKTLQKLVPGSSDYYYYRCLHLQNQGKYAEVGKILATWIKQYGYRSRVQEIRNRQALLTYKNDPKESLRYLQDNLNVRFDHQKEEVNPSSKYPSKLNPAAVSFEAFKQKALSRYKNTDGFTYAGLQVIATDDLNPVRRRHLLERLKYPDIPNLPAMILADLKERGSRGFGSMTIHRQLTLSQLQECLKLQPDLRNQTNFVNYYLQRLRPSDSVDLELNRKERLAYLDRLVEYTRTLGPVHNSLKANVLYARLKFDLERDICSKDLFLEYLKLPKNSPYVNPKYPQLPNNRNYLVRLNYRNDSLCQIFSITSDFDLVYTYLLELLKNADDWQEYAPYVRDRILKWKFAESKVLNGIGDQEKWHALLGSTYGYLKERVDITFAPSNKTVFADDEDVKLKLAIKNVNKLYIKIYKINLLNYYKTYRKEPSPDIDLEGMVPNIQKVVEYDANMFRQIKREYTFPELKERGAYIVEFIGNGRTSRALIRKGQLRCVEKPTYAGHSFVVFNSKQELVKNASLQLGERVFTADKNGFILVPYSARQVRQSVILSDGDLVSLDQFEHLPEKYSFRAGLYVNREDLLPGKKATVVVRPMLSINSMPAPTTLLKDVRLEITTENLQGINSSKTVDQFKLHDNQESLYTFTVPDNLVRVRFALKAKIRNNQQSKDIDLSDSATFRLNGIDKADYITQALLSENGEDKVITVCGKNGEPMVGRQVSCTFSHRLTVSPVHQSLATDANGQVHLGKLPGITTVNAVIDRRTMKWTIQNDGIIAGNRISAMAGQTIRIPYVGKASKIDRLHFMLLEQRGNARYKNWLEAMSLKDGFLTIADLPPGTYYLDIKDTSQWIQISISAGSRIKDFLISDSAISQLSPPKPLQITSLQTQQDELIIRAANARKDTRFHIFTDRYYPEFSALPVLGQGPAPLFTSGYQPLLSHYQSDRNLGEEYAYILRRRGAKAFPGNMLPQPGLLLNPFSLRDTQTKPPPAAAEGEAFAQESVKKYGGSRRGGRISAHRGEVQASPTYDFLANTAPIFLNLRPNASGEIRIKLTDLHDCQSVRVLAVDSHSTICRKLSLPAKKIALSDQRLKDQLDPQKHFIQMRKVSALKQGDELTIRDLAAGKFRIINELPAAFNLLRTISNAKSTRASRQLDKFAFLLNWTILPEKQKLEKYSEFACHELNYFLYSKDKPFFEKHIAPYLANKKDKTFLDKWLLHEDLSAYTEVNMYEKRLNTFEKLLLAQRLKDQNASTTRYISEKFDLIPVDPTEYNYLFDTALQTGALEEDTDKFRYLPTFKITHKGNSAKRMSRAFGSKSKVAEKPGAPPAPKADDMPLSVEVDEIVEEEAVDITVAEDAFGDDDDDAGGVLYAAHQAAIPEGFYQKLPPTQELAENNYYELPIAKQNSNLIQVNAYWRDMARNGSGLSGNVLEAYDNFSEIMMALSSLPLPAKAPQLQLKPDGNRAILAATSPMLVFHREFIQISTLPKKPELMVKQDFFRNDDRYMYEDHSKEDKLVTDGEFLVGKVYGARLVIANPTSRTQPVSILRQIPKGAIPVKNGSETDSIFRKLGPYETVAIEYLFYFPRTGEFDQFPPHVSQNGKLVAFCQPDTFRVVKNLSVIDKTSWDYVSQKGSDEEVINYLKTHNLGRTKLDRIAYHMKNKAFFLKVVSLLRQNHVFNATIWSYGLCHNDVQTIQEFLSSQVNPKTWCGMYIDSPLLKLDPVQNRSYQHLEYAPLINARSYQLHKTREILNRTLYSQYIEFLKVLSYLPKLGDNESLAATYYLLLQNRIEEAMVFFSRVKRDQLPTKIQYDYLAVYLDFYRENLSHARQIAGKYKDYSIPKWRTRFLEALNQLNEAEGKETKVVDKDDRQMKMDALADQEPTVGITTDKDDKLSLVYQNLKEAKLNFYLMDIEFLFSNNPFVSDYGHQFSLIMPNKTITVALPAGKESIPVPIPAEYQATNLLVEVVGAGKTESAVRFANSMNVQLSGRYGQLKVTDKDTRKPLPKVYVKVYAETDDGTVFYKDGYTDIRGRFDYVSVSNDVIEDVDSFSILIISEKNGAVIKETEPPQR